MNCYPTSKKSGARASAEDYIGVTGREGYLPLGEGGPFEADAWRSRKTVE